MNVLVYDGPGVSQVSLSHTVASLKSLLQPNFVVQTIAPKALISEPWTASCALLVIPGGRDLPYLSALDKAIPRILDYVRQGGSYLGICAGAYFASARVEWEIGTDLEVQGDRPLRFFPGTSRGCVYPGFQYNSEDGARTVTARIPNDQLHHGLYYNGGGECVLPSSVAGVTPLAYYEDEDRPGMVAAVMCTVGKGKAALWHIHLEYPVNNPCTVAAAARISTSLTAEQVEQAEAGRKSLLRETLDGLGLKTSSKSLTPPSEPLPQYLCASNKCRGLVTKTEESLKSLENPVSGIIEDANDHFKVHQYDPTSPPQTSDSTSTDSPPVRHVITCKDSLPQPDVTPNFNVSEYFSKLAEARGSRPSSPSAPLHCELGELLFYGEVVTSTQTLLERNPKILEVLPSPLLSIATYQFNGRGRGSNVWASPSGSLLFSLLLRTAPNFPNSKLVFIQYLVGLAVVESCRRVMGEPGKAVVLKWPNDIYAKTMTEKGEELKKVGGVLVNTVFMSGGVRIIAGCGLNVLNSPPLLSLSQMYPPGTTINTNLTMENMAATIMVTLGRMWDEFVAVSGSFEPFMDLYLDRWIHSDQLVTVETVTPPIKVRIIGITPDHGLLRTIPEGKGTGFGQNYIDLQPDGNSFDMMAGLIKTKR